MVMDNQIKVLIDTYNDVISFDESKSTLDTIDLLERVEFDRQHLNDGFKVSNISEI